VGKPQNRKRPNSHAHQQPKDHDLPGGSQDTIIHIQAVDRG
jgi:hypothetical protein